MRKISRHHAHHPESGVPMCEIDMVDETGVRSVLHQEGIASHPLAGRYTGDQIQIIEFINGLLFNKQEPNMSDEEIEYLLYNHQAIARRLKEEEKPKMAEPSAQPSIFGKSIPLVTTKEEPVKSVFVTTPKQPAHATRIEGVSLDGSFYRQEIIDQADLIEQMPVMDDEPEVIEPEVEVVEPVVEPQPEPTPEPTFTLTTKVIVENSDVASVITKPKRKRKLTS